MRGSAKHNNLNNEGRQKMKKIRENKGFTLAELLIVVAIIAVLTAIAIPVFTTQLERSREATDLANVRSAYAEVVTGFLTDGSSHAITVSHQQRQSGWQTSGAGTLTVQVDGSQTSISVKADLTDYTVSITDSGSVSVN